MKNYTNYHNTDYTNKILRDGQTIFERSLATSPDASTVRVNSTNRKIMIQSTSKYNERRILFKQGEVQLGDVIRHEGKDWLVTELPFNNKIYEKSHMILCTQTLTITTESENRIMGYDNLGRPITKTIPGTPLTFPCVVQSLKEYLNEGDMDGQINFPDGSIVLYISNTNNANVSVGKEFNMFGFTYRIYGVNRSKVIDNKGLLMITADKIQ